MKYICAMLLAVAVAFSAAHAEEISEKGSFGVVIDQNFIKFSYVMTYLGESETEGHIGFELAFEDNKGYDIPSEIDDTDTVLKSRRLEIEGKVERKSEHSVLLLFPIESPRDLSGRVTIYTRVFGSKLKKKFRF
jgi:hypothetical protein